MLDFKQWMASTLCEGSNPGAKTGLYPLGYGGIGLYPPQWYLTRSADAIFYLSIDERIYKAKDGGKFGITHIPGKVDCSMGVGDGPQWDISHIGGCPSHPVGKDYAAKKGEGGIWDIRHIKGREPSKSRKNKLSESKSCTISKSKLKSEEAGGYAIVGCGDSPDYQVWGARSDLGCRKKNRMLKMKFRDWAGKREKKDG